MDIDLVYTWVDGDDPQHQQLRTLYSHDGGNRPKLDAARSYRFRSSNEIYQSIQSARVFAPWVRHIYVVVADGQEHRFDHSQCAGIQVQVIPHCVLFEADGCLEHLPTFNSHAIESHLHQIPGLSECFLYANDDTFFGTHVGPELFFNQQGIPQVCASQTIMARRPKVLTTAVESWQWSRWNNSALLDSLMHTPTRVRSPALPQRFEWIHQIRPMRRQFLEQAWAHPTIQPVLHQTSAARFRSPSDIEPVGFLLHWFTSRGYTQWVRIRSHTDFIEDHTSLTGIFEDLVTQQYQLYCLNDGMLAPTTVRMHQYGYLLTHSLPHHQFTQPHAAKLTWRRRPLQLHRDRQASMGKVS